MTVEPRVLDFRNLGLNDLERVGGKNASLGELISQLSLSGIKVPHGFATTAAAFNEFMQVNQLKDKVVTELKHLNINDINQLQKTGATIRALILQAKLPDELVKDVSEAYRRLQAEAENTDEMTVAVRSSATAEDLPEASFAGQQESYLNVKGIEQVLEAIKHVFASLYNDRAISYRVHQGFAKTKSIKTLSDHLEASFKRIQFTPDLLPSDITGTDIYRPDKYQFEFSSGPLFNNLILADEINRAPAKVQSALLEAMAEQQVSIGNHSYPLSSFFLVMATQNSLEQEGTYPLPEAQLDRFLLQINLEYPNSEEEKKILTLMRQQWFTENTKKETMVDKISLERIFQARTAVSKVHIEPQLEEYIVQIIMATRYPSKYNKKLSEWLSYGSSPRGSINLEKTAKAHAWLNNRDYVTPNDIQIMAKDVLPHRIGLSFTAQAEQVNTRLIINKLLEYIAVP